MQSGRFIADRTIDREALASTVRTNLAPVALGLGGVYLFLTISHSLVLPPPLAMLMAFVAGVSATILLVLGWSLRRWEPPLAWAHVIGAGIGSLVLLNSLLHLYLRREPQESTNVVLAIVGLGSLFLSWRWYLMLTLVALLGWAGAMHQIAWPPDWVHFGFMLLQGTVLSALIFVVRVRATVRLARLRARERAQQQALEEVTRAAQESEVMLRRQALTFELISDSVVLIDLQGNVVDSNPASERMYGYTRDEWIGRPPNLWRTMEQAQELLTEISQAVVQFGRWSGEVPFVRKDGSDGVCELVVLPLGGSGELPAALLGVSRDITHRKQTEAALRQAKEAAEAANKAKSAFLAAMSHELRTPLNAIIGYSTLLRVEADRRGDQALIADINNITESGKQLLALISDVLDLTRIEAGKVVLRPALHPISTLIDEVALTIRPALALQQNTLVLVVPEDIGCIYTDPTRLRQVLLNLLSNAAKFTERGTITVQVERQFADGDWICFSVADTGIGISEAQLETLFQDFSPGEDSTTRKIGGAGLGLALSRRLCHLLGGEISVSSQVGQGSVFRVQLPAQLPIAEQLPKVVPAFEQPAPSLLPGH